MDNKFLSVIIPTFNRRETLRRCLDALSEQTFPKSGYEVVLADDGSNDGTADFVRAYAKTAKADIRQIQQEHKGPAAARNAGVRAARGELLLFTGDDIIPDPHMLEEHCEWHRRYPADNEAVLGYCTWSPHIRITPFMKWLEAGGVQFSYHNIMDSAEVDPELYFYTANISLKNSFLIAGEMFDEDFRYAAYEDVELGTRLKKKGLALRFNKKAVGWHEHYTSLGSSCSRMVKVGEAGELLKIKLGQKTAAPQGTPALRKMLRLLRLAFYYPAALLCEKYCANDHVFGYVMGYYRQAGAEHFWRGRK